MDKVDIAGLKVSAVTKQGFLDDALKRIKARQKTFVITPYSEFLYHAFQDPKLLDIFNAADFSLTDGIGIFWAKKYLELPLTAKSYYGKILQALWQMTYSLAAIVFYPSWIKAALPEKIVGADLIWDLADLGAENNLSVFLLGGFKDTPRLAAEAIKNNALLYGRTKAHYQDLKIKWSNKNPDDHSVIADINLAKPDILFVAYGPIKQERWIKENLANLDTKLAIGVGGTLDYLAGQKAVPPKFIRYGGLEWLWRFFTQPYRLKRILNATFGLMSGLWHYKVFRSLPLRDNVAVVIINNKNELLVCERGTDQYHVDIITNTHPLKHSNYWQFPQGGIEPNEDLSKAALREAFEETGAKSLQLIKVSSKTHTYLWNNSLRMFWKNRRKKNCGQKQQIVYLKFIGSEYEIKVDQREFVNFKWVRIEELEKTIHSERGGLAKIVIEDLKEILKSANI